jgi:hypothetical protein
MSTAGVTGGHAMKPTLFLIGLLLFGAVMLVGHAVFAR